MLTGQTLMTLACLIANKGTFDTAKIEAKLTPEEREQVNTMAADIIKAGQCPLPIQVEDLIDRTNAKNKKGLIILTGCGTPSGTSCAAGI